MRGSDPDAAVYYLVAMLEGGEDPRYVARRMIVHASEDVGLADPRALLVAVAAAHALEHVGLPEARLNLAQAAIYIARAPKSNAVLKALGAATDDVRKHGHLRPPDALRDAHYAGAKKLGRGQGYVYPHDDPAGFDVDNLPDELKGRTYYEPSGNGEEAARGSGRRARCAISSTAISPVRFSPVEHRVDLDHLERGEEARLGDHLHDKVRLAVAEAAAHRRADARRDLRVDDIHVERDVHRRAVADVLDRGLHHRLDAHAVEVAHREDHRVEPAEQVALALVDRAGADQRRAAGLDGRQRPRIACENAGPATPSAAASAMPCTLPVGVVSGRVQVGVRIDPEHAARAAAPAPARRACRARSSGRRRGRAASAPPRPHAPRGPRSARTSRRIGSR